jgi:DNA replication and repair protein RecF
MIVDELRLLSFRAHADTQVSFAPGINLLYGANGSGKTNILEAIHFLCLSKSFVASRDRYVLQKGADFFEVEGSFTGDHGRGPTIRLVYMSGEGKEMFLDGSSLERLSDIVGKVPVVVFSPADQAITAGGPSKRRDFVNNTLSQGHPVYLEDVMTFERIRKQRNALLKDFSDPHGRGDAGSLAVWNDRLIKFGGRVIVRRIRFLEEFREFLQKAYRHMAEVGEEPSIEYDTIERFSTDVTAEEVADGYRRELARVEPREKERGRTIVGPHRDEFVFRLDDLKVRRYASQGQHRTFGMALKLAKYFYLREHLDEHPLLLLDDVFGDLDSHRTAVLLELLESDVVRQSLLTAVERASFTDTIDFTAPDHRLLHVKDGGVEEVEVTDRQKR